MIKTCLLGLGRTGQVIAGELIKSKEFDLVSVVAKPDSNKSGRQLSEFMPCNQELVIADANSLIGEINHKRFQVAIDFTSPEACLKNARILAARGVHIVIGTTGFNKIQIYELKKLVEQYHIGLVYAPNISVGVNVLLSIAKTLARLVPHYDVEITESCHRYKKDSPSGTAVKIAEAITNAKGHLKDHKLSYGRKGSTTRHQEEIGIHSIRAGGIVGVHQVLFAGESDEIEITHRSYSREVYAEGALKAAAFITGRPGFYQMEDVLTPAEKKPQLPREMPASLKLNFHV